MDEEVWNQKGDTFGELLNVSQERLSLFQRIQSWSYIAKASMVTTYAPRNRVYATKTENCDRPCLNQILSPGESISKPIISVLAIFSRLPKLIFQLVRKIFSKNCYSLYLFLWAIFLKNRNLHCGDSMIGTCIVRWYRYFKACLENWSQIYLYFIRNILYLEYAACFEVYNYAWI